MTWCLKYWGKLTFLVALCTLLKQSFAFLSPFVLGYENVWKGNVGELRSQNSVCKRLSCPSDTILYLCDSVLSLLLLLNSFNPHTLPWNVQTHYDYDRGRSCPKKVAYDLWQPNVVFPCKFCCLSSTYFYGKWSWRWIVPQFNALRYKSPKGRNQGAFPAFHCY